MNKKITLIFLVLLSTFSNVAASTLFELENTGNKNQIDFYNNIQSEFRTIDQNDKITFIYINLENNGYTNNTGILLNFENNATIMITTNKYYFLYVVPYIDITETVFFQNHTAFNKTFTSNNVVPLNIITTINYDIATGNTSIKTGNVLGRVTVSNLNIFTDYSTNGYIGMPSGDVLMTGLSTFVTRIIYQDIHAKEERLSIISKLLYLLLNTVYKIVSFDMSADSETLLNILLLLDGVFWALSILFLAVFTHPNLILVWLLIVGNFYVAWKSTSLREIMFNYMDYLKAVCSSAYRLFTYVWTIIIKLIQTILTAIP